MSAASETYIDIGKNCLDHIDQTFEHDIRNLQRHKNEIINLSRRVESLCKKIGNKKVKANNKNTVINLIEINKELYRLIFEEEPPLIEGHNLHIAISILERICILMAKHNCMTLMRSKPTLEKF